MSINTLKSPKSLKLKIHLSTNQLNILKSPKASKLKVTQVFFVQVGTEPKIKFKKTKLKIII